MSRLLNLSLAAILVASVAGCTAAGRTTTTPAPAAETERPIPHGIDIPGTFQRAVAEGTRTASGLPGPAYWTQSADYEISARLLPEEKRLEGTARIVYHNNSPDRLDRLHLELAQNLHREGAIRSGYTEVTGGVELERVVVEGEELEAEARTGARYRVTGTQLVLYPASPVEPGSSVTIETDWSFTIAAAGAGGRMGYNGDDFFFLAYWYPAMSVYDDVSGWHTDQFQGQAEFYHDFGVFDVTVDVPHGWIVAATGTLQNAEDVLAPEVLERMRRAHASDETLQVLGPDDFGAGTRLGEGGRLQWHFSASQVRDFAFSATRASIWDAARTPVGDLDGDGQTDYAQINTFYRESAPLWSEVTRYQQHAIRFLSEHTGFPYPWPHMTAVEGAGIIGGGMEFPMMTLMGDYNTQGDSALYNVTAHELAHMWIPLIVSTNERRYSWMDEGTTTFNENVARTDFHSGPNHYLGDHRLYTIVARQEQAGEMREGEIMRWSDYHYPGISFTVASYMKPATLLVALRAVLGEATFNSALRSFIADWAYKHPYPWDFFNTFERISGRDLDWFWRPWYYETWTLDQAIAGVQMRGGEAVITLEDLGRVPMPVFLTLTLQDGRVVRHEVPVDVWLSGAASAVVTVNTGGPVERVEIDPEFFFPDVDRNNNVWVRE